MGWRHGSSARLARCRRHSRHSRRVRPGSRPSPQRLRRRGHRRRNRSCVLTPASGRGALRDIGKTEAAIRAGRPATKRSAGRPHLSAWHRRDRNGRREKAGIPGGQIGNSFRRAFRSDGQFLGSGDDNISKPLEETARPRPCVDQHVAAVAFVALARHQLRAPIESRARVMTGLVTPSFSAGRAPYAAAARDRW